MKHMKKTDEIREEVNAEYGEDALQSLVATGRVIKDGLSSGLFSLNVALSGNPFLGYVWGRTVEIYGPEGSGKTTLALHAIVEAQKLGLPVVFVDAEHALDPVYASDIGIELSDLLIHQPDYGEQAIEVTEASLKAGVRLVVIDSVAALTPRTEIEGEVGDARMGEHARLMGKAMRRLVGLTAKNQALIIYINQIRMKVGTIFGNPETTPGGKALKFFASYRIEIRSPRGGADKTKSLEGSTVETGTLSKIKVVKNKLYPPFRTAEVHIEYGKGVDRRRDAVDLLLKYGEKTSRISLSNGKSYTRKSLVASMKKSSSVRRAVVNELKRIGE